MGVTEISIVKIQLDSTGKRLLLYDEGRTFSDEIVGEDRPELFQRIVDVCGLTPLTKCYCRADLSGEGRVVLIGKVEDQPW